MRRWGKQKRETEKVQSKTKSWLARAQILEAEIRSLRSDFEAEKTLLTQKSTNDDVLIASLRQDLQSKQAEITRVKGTGAKGKIPPLTKATQDLQTRITQVT